MSFNINLEIPTFNKFSVLNDSPEFTQLAQSSCPKIEYWKCERYPRRQNKGAPKSEKNYFKNPQTRRAVAALLTACLQEESDSDKILAGDAFERMHSLETLGISKNDVSDPDEITVKNSKKSIKIKEGRYHVDILWNEEILNKVPSNCLVCKAIAKKS